MKKVREIIEKEVFGVYKMFQKHQDLARRLNVTEVGLSGNVSVLDKSLAEQERIKPLRKFERWVFAPSIEKLKKERRYMFREACIEILGEDPEEW